MLAKGESQTEWKNLSTSLLRLWEVLTHARVAPTAPYVNEEQKRFVRCVIGKMTAKTIMMPMLFEADLTNISRCQWRGSTLQKSVPLMLLYTSTFVRLARTKPNCVIVQKS
jgi:hypothetical protein